MSRYRSFADAAEKPKWTPIVNPKPVFNGPAEKLNYEEAIRNFPKPAGMDVIAWLDKIVSTAREAAVASIRLPYREPEPLLLIDREPGEDDE